MTRSFAWTRAATSQPLICVHIWLTQTLWLPLNPTAAENDPVEVLARSLLDEGKFDVKDAASFWDVARRDVHNERNTNNAVAPLVACEGGGIWVESVPEDYYRGRMSEDKHLAKNRGMEECTRCSLEFL